MEFFELSKRQPQNGQWCLLQEWTENRKRILLFHWPQQWDEISGCFGLHKRVVRWTPLPEHYLDNGKGWKSPYRGDDFPDSDTPCLVCVDSASVFRRPVYAYYKADLSKFLGITDGTVIAFMELKER